MSTFSAHSLPVAVPLCYDTVYYVESPDNEPLNQAMRRIAQSREPLFADAQLQPFPFKLLCLTRAELEPEQLRTKLPGTFDPELVDETINNLRLSLEADTGGTLTARSLPKFSYDDVREDDRTVCTFEKFSATRPEEAEENVRLFARSVAMENFQRIAGVSFHSFQSAQEEARQPRTSRRDFCRDSYSSSYQSIGFMVVRPDPKAIVRRLQERLAAIENQINEQTNYDDVIGMLEADLQSLKNKYKMDTICKVEVDDDKIYLWISKKERREILFDRRDFAKTLFVFYLQQIQRANRNPGVSRYLSQLELEEYKDELYKIYQYFSGRQRCSMKDIQSLWDKSAGYGFRDATSSIRNYFKEEFDVEAIEKKYHKCYFSAKQNEKDQFGYIRYGIDLDEEDFDIEQFTYKKMPSFRI